MKWKNAYVKRLKTPIPTRSLRSPHQFTLLATLDRVMLPELVDSRGRKAMSHAHTNSSLENPSSLKTNFFLLH